MCGEQCRLPPRQEIEEPQTIKLEKVLKRKNPYLFKAKDIMSAEQLVRSFMDAHMSSREETIFSEFLEGLAIFINGEIYGGTKSLAEGIDLEFEKDGIKYSVSIKSGPNWGNSSQINLTTFRRLHFANGSRGIAIILRNRLDLLRCTCGSMALTCKLCLY